MVSWLSSLRHRIHTLLLVAAFALLLLLLLLLGLLLLCCSCSNVCSCLASGAVLETGGQADGALGGVKQGLLQLGLTWAGQPSAEPAGLLAKSASQ